MSKSIPRLYTRRPIESKSDKAFASVTSAKTISFDDVVRRYDISAEQLKNDMKQLRWKQVNGVYLFDLKQIRARYQVDSDKLEALAKLQAVQEG